jgi:23S rRNA (adenine2503-C2)-methyltransferase
MNLANLQNERGGGGISPADSPKNLLGFSLAELTDLVRSVGEPDYRAKQLFQGIYRERLGSLDEISTLSKSLRAKLREAGWDIVPARINQRFTSVDGTVRYLIGFPDTQSVETVWMPEGDLGESGDGSEAGEEELRKRFGRATICVSSQVGCAVNCHFCMTALLGLQRNLTAGEIVGQIIAVLNDHQVDLTKDRINLVFMGQGEPFHNYANWISAVRLLVEGVGIAESRMTVSTSGIVPKIVELGKEAIRPKLAISLNASSNEQRTELMPLNKKWPIEEVIAAARSFPLRNREKMTFEYVLLDGVNDTPEDAQRVVSIVRQVPDAKVNLIAWNSGPELPFHTPADSRVQAFQNVLRVAGIPAFIRRPRGRDIYAACGQLKKTVA